MAARDESSRPRHATTVERSSDREILVTRSFDAPPSIVFEVWTNPEYVRRWWSPRSCTEIVDVQVELRVGGLWRYVTRAGGEQHAFVGRYLEVTPPSRLVYTEIFEPPGQRVDPDDGAIVTVTFEAEGDGTRLVSRSLFPSKEVLDRVLAMGVEGGLRETLEQFDAVLASLTGAGVSTAALE